MTNAVKVWTWCVRLEPKGTVRKGTLDYWQSGKKISGAMSNTFYCGCWRPVEQSCWKSPPSSWRTPPHHHHCPTHCQAFSSPGKTWLSKTEKGHLNLWIHRTDLGKCGKIWVEMEPVPWRHTNVSKNVPGGRGGGVPILHKHAKYP